MHVCSLECNCYNIQSFCQYLKKKKKKEKTKTNIKA